MTILTGMMTGSTAHPAAAFRFVLQLPDQRQVRLYCNHPSCAPGVIAGSVVPYAVDLAPNHAFYVDIPLADLRSIDGDQEADTIPTTLGRRLIVTFTGEPVFLKGNAVDSGDHAPYWVGTVSQQIPLLLKLVPPSGKP